MVTAPVLKTDERKSLKGSTPFPSANLYNRHKAKFSLRPTGLRQRPRHELPVARLNLNQHEKQHEAEMRNDKWDNLVKFASIGTTHNTISYTKPYYDLSDALPIIDCIREDSSRTAASLYLDDSKTKYDSTPLLNKHGVIFAAALLIARGETQERQAIAKNAHRILWNSEDLFLFVYYAMHYRGWGRLLRKAVNNWYINQSYEPDELNTHIDFINDVFTTPNAHGYSHKKLISLAHVRPETSLQATVFGWLTSPEPMVTATCDSTLPGIIQLIIILNNADLDMAEMMIDNYNIPFRAIRDKLPEELMLKRAAKSDVSIEDLIHIDTKTHIFDGMNRSKYIDILEYKIASLVGLREDYYEVLPLLLHAYSKADYSKNSLIDLAEKHYKKYNKQLYKTWSINGLCGIETGLSYKYKQDAKAVPYMTIIHHLMAAHNTRLIPLNGSNIITIFNDTTSVIEDLKHIHKIQSQSVQEIAEPILYAIKKHLKIDYFLLIYDIDHDYYDINPIEAMKRYRTKINRFAKLIIINTNTDFDPLKNWENQHTLDQDDYIIHGHDMKIYDNIKNIINFHAYPFCV